MRGPHHPGPHHQFQSVQLLHHTNMRFVSFIFLLQCGAIPRNVVASHKTKWATSQSQNRGGRGDTSNHESAPTASISRQPHQICATANMGRRGSIASGTTHPDPFLHTQWAPCAPARPPPPTSSSVIPFPIQAACAELLCHPHDVSQPQPLPSHCHSIPPNMPPEATTTYPSLTLTPPRRPTPASASFCTSPPHNTTIHRVEPPLTVYLQCDLDTS